MTYIDPTIGCDGCGTVDKRHAPGCPAVTARYVGGHLNGQRCRVPDRATDGYELSVKVSTWDRNYWETYRLDDGGTVFRYLRGVEIEEGNDT